MTLLLHLNGVDEGKWAGLLKPLLGAYPVVTRADRVDPEAIAYILCWKPDPQAFAGLSRLKAVLSYGAGVDALLRHPGLPPDLPLVRFVEPDLTERMRDYVVAEVLAHTRLETRLRAAQQAHRWAAAVPPRTAEIAVGIMGLGVLGQAALAALGPLGYRRRGWSRTARRIDGVETFAGAQGLDAFLAGTDILVCLLPLTPQTRGILNRSAFSRLRHTVLPGGPAIVNAARGGHLVEADLVAALADGRLGAASLDVFAEEPLPADNPLWDLAQCRITPHIAAVSDPAAGAAYFARVIRDHEAGLRLPNLVDRARGY